MNGNEKKIEFKYGIGCWKAKINLVVLELNLENNQECCTFLSNYLNQSQFSFKAFQHSNHSSSQPFVSHFHSILSLLSNHMINFSPPLLLLTFYFQKKINFLGSISYIHQQQPKLEDIFHSFSFLFLYIFFYFRTKHNLMKFFWLLNLLNQSLNLTNHILATNFTRVFGVFGVTKQGYCSFWDNLIVSILAIVILNIDLEQLKKDHLKLF